MPAVLLIAAVLVGPSGAHESGVPRHVLGESVLPRPCRFSEYQILPLAVPGYDERVHAAETSLAGGDEDFGAYEAAVTAYRFLPLGKRRARILVVLVHEIESACTDCRNAVVAAIDYTAGAVLQRARLNGNPVQDSLSVQKGPHDGVGITFRILHVGCCGSGAEETWLLRGRPDEAGNLRFDVPVRVNLKTWGTK